MTWKANEFRGTGHALTLDELREMAEGAALISPIAAAALPEAIAKDWFAVKVLGIMLVPKGPDGRPIVDGGPPLEGEWVEMFDARIEVKHD